MEKSWLFAMAIIVTTLSACAGNPGILRGPGLEAGTPDPAAFNLPGGGEPVNILISNVLADPLAFDGRRLQVTGFHRVRQPLACQGRRQESPATWALGEGELELPVAGPADLMPVPTEDELQVTVVGTWQRWRGLRGCDGAAIPAELWYLEVSDILWPEAIALVPVDDSGDPQTIFDSDQGQPAIEDMGALATSPPEQLGGPVPGTITLTPAPGQAPGSFATQVSYPGPTTGPLIPAGGSATPTPNLTTSPPDAEPLSSPTPSPETSGAKTQATLSSGSLETGNLKVGDIHRWPYTIFSAQTIQLQAASDEDLSVKISIRDPAGRTLAEAASTEPGQPILLDDVFLSIDGTYQILVSAPDGSAGDYAILLGSDGSYRFVFRGLLEVGELVGGQIEPENDHFWHFSGNPGEIVNITATPLNDEDLFLRFFDPDGLLLVNYQNEQPMGEAETLTDFELPAMGLYSLLVGERNFGAAEYSLEMDKE
jgi:hypothetical protein